MLHICNRAKQIAKTRKAPIDDEGIMGIDIKDVIGACEELAQSPKFVYMK